MLRVLCCTLLGGLLFYRAMFPGMRLPPARNTQVLSETPRHVYARLVYVVLDGLRFDALVPVHTQGHYHNRMSIVSDPAVQSRAFLSVAGIPTATTTRVVALMTGAPSGPLDLVWAFTAHRVAADNLTTRFREPVFFGDECWPAMFPALAGRSTTMPSYSRTDQAGHEDTLVDSIVAAVSTRQHTVFAHLTTLDTYGHAFGIDHAMIASTLDRWNRYLYRIYDAIDDETLLVVVSDHGVTNHGAHGGCTAQELASVCVFFAKQPPAAGDSHRTESPQAGYRSFISRFYNVADANTQKDWVDAKEPYDVIHQDDIVVTIAYLLRVSPPLNAYGNLIPFLVSDGAAEQALASLKARHPALHGRGGSVLSDPRAENYRLTAEIHKAMTARHRGKALCALLLCTAAFWLLLRQTPPCALTRSLLSPLFATFLATHSIRAFTSEDLLWSAVLLVAQPHAATAALLLLYARTPGRPVLSMDRIALPLTKFQDTTALLSTAALYAVLRSLRLRPPASRTAAAAPRTLEIDCAFLEAAWPLRDPLLHVCTALMRNRWDRTARLTLVASDPSPWALVAAHLHPEQALLTLLTACTLDPLHSPGTLYALLSFLPYCSNLEKMVQSISYESLFMFSDAYAAILLSAVAYLVLPRTLVISRFYRTTVPRNPSVVYPLLILNLFGLFFAFLCAWVQHGHLAFQNFFVSRLLFVTGYFIADTAVWISLEAAARFHTLRSSIKRCTLRRHTMAHTGTACRLQDAGGEV